MNPDFVRSEINAALLKLHQDPTLINTLRPIRRNQTEAIQRFFKRTTIARIKLGGNGLARSNDKFYDNFIAIMLFLFKERWVGYDQAHYDERLDAIILPHTSDAAYRHEDPCDIEAHEYIHATGHRERLNRPSMLSPTQHDEEEAVAALGSALVLEHFRLFRAVRQADYLLNRTAGGNLQRAQALVEEQWDNAVKAAKWLFDTAEFNRDKKEQYVSSPYTRANLVAQVEADERVNLHKLPPWTQRDFNHRVWELVGNEIELPTLVSRLTSPEFQIILERLGPPR